MTVLIAGAAIILVVGAVLVLGLLRTAAIDPPAPIYDPDNLHGWSQDPPAKGGDRW